MPDRDWYSTFMRRFAAYKRSIGSLALCLSCACGGGARGARIARDAAADAAHAADAAGSADAGPLRTFLQAEVEQFDRRVRAICPCLVASGSYKTEQECLDLSLSGPDWVQCAAKALADYDSPATRADSQCYVAFLQEAADCTESAACDNTKLAVCGTPQGDCLAKQSMRLNLILAACPDFGLLSRVSNTDNERDN
jgi:hypothetical protein